MLKPLIVFKTMSGFPFSNISFLNLNHCRVFETNPTFPSIILNSDQNFFELKMDYLLVLELISPEFEIGCFVEPLKSLKSFNV